jgi:hypothetical protein
MYSVVIHELFLLCSDLSAHDIVIPMKSDTIEGLSSITSNNEINKHDNFVKSEIPKASDNVLSSPPPPPLPPSRPLYQELEPVVSVTAQDEAEMEAINAINSRSNYLGRFILMSYRINLFFPQGILI